MLLSRRIETICARATPPGASALAIVRLSGVRSIEIAQLICDHFPETPESHRAFLSPICDERGQPFDEALVLPFLGGKSFTGEEAVEFSLHGNDQIVQKLMSVLIFHGARLAEPGEFSFRAFINRKLDLIQAESVLSMIEAPSEKAILQSLAQLSGSLSTQITGLEKNILFLLANLEADIDFSQENLETLSAGEAEANVRDLLQIVDKLVESAEVGKYFREGIRVALVGRPNVGKSSLLNLLAGRDRALVSEEPGTTRDFIDVAIVNDGIKINFIDTAGLREASSSLELASIKKTFKILRESDFIFFVFDEWPIDISSFFSHDAYLTDEKAPGYCVLLNKTDLRANAPAIKWVQFRGVDVPVIPTSSFSEDSRGAIMSQIQKWLRGRLPGGDDSTLLHERQIGLLRRLQTHLRSAEGQLKSEQSAEFIAFELREALLLSQELIGRRYDDQVIDQIFKQFCLGK